MSRTNTSSRSIVFLVVLVSLLIAGVAWASTASISGFTVNSTNSNNSSTSWTVGGSLLSYTRSSYFGYGYYYYYPDGGQYATDAADATFSLTNYDDAPVRHRECIYSSRSTGDVVWAESCDQAYPSTAPFASTTTSATVYWQPYPAYCIEETMLQVFYKVQSGDSPSTLQASQAAL